MSNFNGSNGDDVFNGDGTDEVIRGKGGNDRLYGGGGQDVIEGGDGTDYLDGGDGDDRLYSNNQVTISLPYYSTDIFSPPAIDSGTERDTLYGGNGSDKIYAGYGDTVDGGPNDVTGDYLYISFLAAPSGITFDGGLATQVIGGATITGIENISFVQGSNFDDTINGRSLGGGYSEFGALMGMGGNDTLLAGDYTGTLFGGDGNDVVDGRGSQYLQAVYGDDGDDTLYTNSNTFAKAYGGAGNDTIYAHGTVYGGSGNDLIVMQSTYYQGPVYGDSGDDEIRACDAGNVISGGGGADRLIGSISADILSSADFAGAGNYTGSGYVPGDDMGLERDTITGGGGDDDIGIGIGDDADGGDGSDQLRLSLGGAAAGISFDGSVRPTRQLLAAEDAAEISSSSSQPFSALQFITRGDPAGGDDVCAVPVVVAERRGPSLRARHRCLPRDRADVVEQVRTAVRWRHTPTAGQSDARLPPLALASR